MDAYPQVYKTRYIYIIKRWLSIFFTSIFCLLFFNANAQDSTLITLKLEDILKRKGVNQISVKLNIYNNTDSSILIKNIPEVVYGKTPNLKKYKNTNNDILQYDIIDNDSCICTPIKSLFLPFNPKKQKDKLRNIKIKAKDKEKVNLTVDISGANNGHYKFYLYLFYYNNVFVSNKINLVID